jgi:hypothetical protein
VVPTPTLASHAATKSYADTAAGTHTVVVKTSSYSATASEEVILVNASTGSATITLPTAVGSSRIYTVKKVDSSSNNVVVNTTSSQTIDGGLTATIRVQYVSISVASDGSNWLVI